MDLFQRNEGVATIPHIKDWLDDLGVAVALLTRVPMPHPQGAAPPNLARAQRVFPLVGAAIGAVVGVADLALLAINIPAFAAAALALGAGALLTGALHEDGLADVADGFGGGRERAAKLEIMHDSRLGTYGALCLLVAFAARLSALAALPQAAVVPGLIAAHALARSPFAVLAATMPFARSDGLAKSAGRPEPVEAVISVASALLVALVCLPLPQALLAATLTAVAAAAVAVLAQRQIGGVTGDVFGAAEQVAETAVLLALAARLG
jgi:adenosylcobinamide-GDP ribazoletransferase